MRPEFQGLDSQQDEELVTVENESYLHKNLFECSPEEVVTAIEKLAVRGNHTREELQAMWDRTRQAEGVSVREFYNIANQVILCAFPTITRDV